MAIIRKLGFFTKLLRSINGKSSHW